MDQEKKVGAVSIGELHQVEIIGIGVKGDGIAKIDGFALIVPKAKLGDQVTVKILKVLPHFAFAELVGGDY